MTAFSQASMRVFALPFLVLTAFSQAIVKPYPSPAAPAAESRIRLDVVVNDKSGKPVAGLEQQDFTILDSKEPQKILSFEAVSDAASDREPVEAILIVDSVNIGFERVAYARDQIKRFLRENDAKLAVPLSIAFLTDKGFSISGASSRDGNAEIASLDQNQTALRTITRSQGFYGADDRNQLSVSAVSQLVEYAAQRPGRKIVIWVSPGWPMLSGPNVQLTQKEQFGIFRTIVALSTGLRQAGITLYSVDPLGTADAATFRTSYYEQFLKGVRKSSQVLIGDLGLQVLAYQSGGRVLNSDNDVANSIARCVRDASAYYVLTFEARAADGPDDYHAIEVKIGRPHLKAQTRTGYYAQPGQPHTP